MFSQEDESIKKSTHRGDSPMRGFVVKLLTGLLSAAALAVFDIQIKGQWAPWAQLLTLVLLGAIALYFLVWAGMTGLSWWRGRREARRIEMQTRGPLLACAAMFTEALSQSFVKGAGNVLNSLHEAHALDPRTCNAYHTHLGTLATGARYLGTDLRSERLSADEGLQRLSEMHRDYVRMNCEIASAVSTTDRTDIRRSWDEIREHTNLISNRLTELGTEMRESGHARVSHPYFPSVPRP
ncbi:MAG: hypothetical protein JSR66_13130 [Proteobacteria bacterium]|nr:hypothetical protein [Pseudomonadota bacterium]